MPIKILDNPILDDKAIKRFWSKVLQLTNTCWPWLDGESGRGYGTFHYQKHNYKPHRLMWLLVHGDIPDRLQVLHKCDNRLCVNPDHLFLGTQQDNINDAKAKHRLVNTRKTIYLTAKEEQLIQQRYQRNDQTFIEMLAQEYNVSVKTIRDVLYPITPKIVSTKVTNDLIYQIKNDYALKRGSMRDLAHKYHVNSSTVCAIINDKYKGK